MRPLTFRSVRALLASAMLVGSAAYAEGDRFLVGDGHSGDQSIHVVGAVVNQYAVLEQPAAEGTTSVQVSSQAGFGVGDLVLVLQSTGTELTLSSGDNGLLDLSADTVGRYEFARIASLTTTGFTLTAPLTAAFPSFVTQLIKVPEYTTLDIAPGASIVAKPWDGQTGGVVVLLVAGVINNGGTVSADGAGFRGGLLINDPSTTTVPLDLDLPEPGGAHKGESLDPLRYSLPGSSVVGTTGRGNIGSGGGGADHQNAGGAGGGNGGQGGSGGLNNTNEAGGGIGGAAMRFPLTEQLLFGGGGGAGHENNNAGTSGGAGGGVVLVRANSIIGAGIFSANGESAAPTPNPGYDGSGAGGGGGTIVLRSVGELSCAQVQAIGGNGSSPGQYGNGDGPGGGGGGGQVFVQGPTGVCAVSVLAGVCGVQPAPSTNGPNGASPTDAHDPLSIGRATEVLTAFALPASPSLTAPAAGSHQHSVSALSGSAEPDVEVRVSLDGDFVATVESDASGRWSLPLTVWLATGAHQVQLAARRDGLESLPSPGFSFQIDLEGHAGRKLSVGCSCDTVPGAISGMVPWLAALALGLRFRRVGRR